MKRSVYRALALLLLAAGLPVLVLQSSGTAATSRPADGLTQATAAGSCWEIKQNYPSSTDGVYWIVTPALQAPTQIYCDQTTDGGGWELIGRGRQGWKVWYYGWGSADALRNTPSGTGAFAPAQLPTPTVDGLLNNTAVSSLPDGIRLRRALDVNGSTWQEVRFKEPSRGRWAWTFGAQNPVGTYTFNGAGSSGGNTSNFGQDQVNRRVYTTAVSAQGFLWGFAYGSSVKGTNSATSYIWSNTTGGGNGIPFTQMYIRPKLTRDSMYSGVSVDDSGTAKQELRAEPSSYATKTSWGVTGLADGVDSETHTEVSAFTQVGSTVFVGGDFKTVQRDSAGTDQQAQSDLAGFNVDSGDYVSTFRPTFNAQVKALAALPDGRVAVGGNFSTVDGQPQSGLAFLDPTTGALSGPQVQVQNRAVNGVVSVRGLSVRNGYLYVAGSFTHIVQGSYTSSDWNGGRIDLSNSRPDIHWNPNINGTSIGVDGAAQGDRVYYSGYFSTVQSQNAPRVNAVAPTANAPIALPGWVPRFSTTQTASQWQLAVKDVGDRFYYGGSQHFLSGYDRTSLQSKSGSITLSGGDIQSIWNNSTYGAVFAGCHCGDFSYQDAYNYSNVAGFTQADSINTFGAWDSATGNFLPDFNPIVKGRKGYGAWALFTDSNNNLWAGGDYVSSVRSDYADQWSGGFVRYAPRDIQAPTTPSNLTYSNVDLKTFKLSWGASTDNSGKAPTYEVIEGNRVIATSTTTSAVINRIGGSQRYFVRAVDATGNRSASTSVLNLTNPDPDNPPAAPAAPSVNGQATSPTTVRLTWPSQTADGGFVVSRDGNTVATLPSGSTQYDDTGLTPSTTYAYTVSAVDQWGQSTASSPLNVSTTGQTTFVANDATWRYRFDSTAPDSGWTGTSYDDSAWKTGTGPLGFGTALAATDISAGAPSPRPLSAQFRTSFQVADVNSVGTPTLTFVADDGVVVYVNGVEVKRQNLPTGTITSNTYATAAPRSTTANANPVVMTIPTSLLVDGTNVISAETHVNYRATPDALFRLSLTATQ
jgi:hypothetical protein